MHPLQYFASKGWILFSDVVHEDRPWPRGSSRKKSFPGLGLGLGLENPGLGLGLATLALTTSLVPIEGGRSFCELELMKFLYNTMKSINLQTLL
jgi:hypothetical protein